MKNSIQFFKIYEELKLQFWNVINLLNLKCYYEISLHMHREHCIKEELDHYRMQYFFKTWNVFASYQSI